MFEDTDIERLLFGLTGVRASGGDRGAFYPASDWKDQSNGARFIPFRVTGDRRGGRHVEFIQECRSPNCWYWLYDDGDRDYHYDGMYYDINKLSEAKKCEFCNNTNLRGGYIKATKATKRQAIRLRAKRSVSLLEFFNRE